MFHVPAHKQIDPAKAPGQIVHAAPAKSADFVVSDHGSIFILTALSEAAARWVREHIPADAQHWGGGIVVEHSYIPYVMNGIISDGLEVA